MHCISYCALLTFYSTLSCDAFRNSNFQIFNDWGFVIECNTSYSLNIDVIVICSISVLRNHDIYLNSFILTITLECNLLLWCKILQRVVRNAMNHQLSDEFWWDLSLLKRYLNQEAWSSIFISYTARTLLSWS